MEQFASGTVACPVVFALRGAERPTPGLWEAFDDEGSRGSRIVHNPLPRQNWSSGATRMSVAVAPVTQGLAVQKAARCIFVSHTLPPSSPACVRKFGCAWLRPCSQPVGANDCGAKGLD
jgi:hypothetical protein